jgi:nucleoside triphosphate pyrophosphatase
MIDLPAGTRLVLASASPRRAHLLRSVGLDPEVRPADLDETVRPGEPPARYVRRLSLAKAAAVARPGELVLAADTTVEVGGEILGKPADETDLRRMLGLLSGVTHRVHTGVSVTARTGGTRTDVVTTEVTFVELDGPTTEWYVAHGESVDKAGGYALQGAGAALVAGVRGSVTNVIGLPLAESLALLRSALG